MYFGLTMDKLLLIGLLVALVIGPERLATSADSVKKLIRQGRDMVRTISDRTKSELGSDFDDVDWRSLDPRQYDPRRIIRAALLEETAPTTQSASDPQPAAAGRMRPSLPAAMMPKNAGPSALPVLDATSCEEVASVSADIPEDLVESETSDPRPRRRVAHSDLLEWERDRPR